MFILVISINLLYFSKIDKISESFFFDPSQEKTIEVLLVDNGRKAKGPYFVKTWIAKLFSFGLWFIKNVYA